MELQLTTLTADTPHYVVHPWAIYLEERSSLAIRHDVVSPISGGNRFTVNGGNHSERVYTTRSHHHIDASCLEFDGDIVLIVLCSPDVGNALAIYTPCSLEVKLPALMLFGVAERGHLAVGDFFLVAQVVSPAPSTTSIYLSSCRLSFGLRFTGNHKTTYGDVRDIVASLFKVATDVEFRLLVRTLSDVVITNFAVFEVPDILTFAT